MRFTLRWLFGAVLLAALSFGALVNSNLYWAALAWIIAITFLAAAAVRGIHSAGESRAFWFGVAGVGWVYLIILSLTQYWFARDFLSDELSRALWDTMGRGELQPLSRKAGRDIYGEAGLQAPSQRFFDVVIKCLVMALFAFSGGYLSVWLCAWRKAPKRAAAG